MPDKQFASFQREFCSVLFQRDLAKCAGFFAEFDQYEKIFSEFGTPDSLDRNFTLAKSDFLDDCKRVMDQLPKAGETLRVVKIDYSEAKITETDSIVRISGALVHVGYGLRLARCTLSLPPMIMVEGKCSFVERFQGMVRFQILDPETGE
ncbi:hypothetical protein HZ994_02480 [Akkermansiaceae bacterium]|nr:hypothetical protein HZ994_02480 [Akkermansiaceae bacterium]